LICAALFLAADEARHPHAFFQQNTQPVATARIRGRVVAADTGLPIANARVEARDGGIIVFAPTGDQGQYDITGLKPGRYTVVASKPGLVVTEFDQLRAGQSGRMVDVGPGDLADGIDIRVLAGGVIVVRVIDEVGTPVPMATVDAFRRRPGNPEWQSAVSGSTAVFGSTIAKPSTDDRGEFRLSGLAPGEYYVQASVPAYVLASGIRPPGAGRLFVPTFFPGATAAADALPVEVRAGQEAPVSIQLVAAPTATVTGRFMAPDDALARGVAVLLRPAQGAPVGVTVRLRNRFEFEMQVMPGQYVLTATTEGLPWNKYFGFADISVHGDISDLVIPLTPGGTLAGRFVSDAGSLPSASMSNRSLTLIPAPGSPRISAGVQTTFNEWTFDVSGIVGTYLIRSTPGSGWVLKSVLLGDADITDTPLAITDGRRVDGVTVVLTQRQTELTGDVTDGQRGRVSDFTVVLFPEDMRYWTPQSRFIGTGRAGQRGDFSVRGLPPGRYLAAAVESLEPGDEFDPKFLARLQKTATRFTLAEAEAKRISVTLQK
jgi:hypothetical protein